MSDAIELLNGLDASLRLANLGDEPHIIVGSDRFITVPDELKRIAVQFDHNIETVTFDCPRYWDGHDMSTMNIYINYLRSDNAPGVYKVDNIRVNDINTSLMHFDWTITKNVTNTSGNIVFIVCVKKADEDGVEQNHWNSEICKDCYVSAGLEIDGGVSENIRPDLIEQWYRELLAMAESGEFDGAPGVGIASIKQTTTSLSDGGKNIVTITLTDGQIEKVVIRNGTPGDGQLPIINAESEDGVTYTSANAYEKDWLEEGKQIVFIPNITNNATEQCLWFRLVGMLDIYPIALRTQSQSGIIMYNYPAALLVAGLPYIMTFTGSYWLVDSYVEIPQEESPSSQLPLVTAAYRDGETYIYTGEYIEGIADAGKQVIFIPVGGGPSNTNTSENVKLQFQFDNGNLMRHDVKLRSATLGTTTVPIGALKYQTPYTMTFTGEYWLIDSYMGISDGGMIEGVTQSQMEDYVHDAIADINQATVVNAESDDGITYTSIDIYEEDWLEEGKQIVFVPETISHSGELKLHLAGMDKSYPISLRPVVGHSTVIIPLGLFQPKVPYIMTFSLDTWWVDSYIDMPNNNAQLPVITVKSRDGETFTYSSSYIEGLFEKGRQIIVILDDSSQSNTTETPELSFEFNDGYESQTNVIDIRSELYIYNNVPIGALKPRIPYTMTFDGQRWLIDSYIEVPQNVYTQDNEPFGAPEGSIWIDTDEESSGTGDNGTGTVVGGVSQLEMETYVANQIAQSGHVSTSDMEIYVSNRIAQGNLVSTSEMASYVAEQLSNIGFAEEGSY